MTVLRAGSATDVGRVRHTNQDLALDGPDLFAVADGMGGHAGGEVASNLAIETLQNAFARHPSADGLRQAINEANAAIWRRSLLDSDLRGMGTTLTAAALVPAGDGQDVVVLANVGDSRAYLYSAGRITQVTADHSLAEEKVRQGELTEAEAAVHPHRHILTRALGVGPDVAVDLWEVRLQEGDRLLLCSDGLTNEVEDDQIAQVMGTVPEPNEAADALVALANQHGGADNITAVVVDVLVADEASAGDGHGPTEAAAVGPAALVDGLGQRRSPSERDVAAVGGVPVGGRPNGEAYGGGDLTAVVPAVGPAQEGAAARVAEPAGPVKGNGASTRIIEPELPPPLEEKPGWWARRRERRRRLRAAGIPRRITLRVLVFFVLIVGVVLGAYFFVRWYANDNWYVTVKGNELVVYQGRSGGLLWFQPKIVDRSGVTTNDVLSTRIPALRADVQEPSLSAAKRYISNLVQEKFAQEQINQGQSPGVTTTTILPTTTTTAPAALGGPVTSTTSVVVPTTGAP